MMSRKDFRLIAETISKIEDKIERKAMAEYNAKLCEKSNPRFNRAKFFEVCKVS